MAQSQANGLFAAGHDSIPGWVGSYLFQNAIPFFFNVVLHPAFPK
jgi:hypothetical protein